MKPLLPPERIMTTISNTNISRGVPSGFGVSGKGGRSGPVKTTSKFRFASQFTGFVFLAHGAEESGWESRPGMFFLEKEEG